MQEHPIKLLVLGASGMLGNAVFRLFTEEEGYSCVGTVRSERSRRFFPRDTHENLISGVDVEKHDDLIRLFADIQPNLVVNCVGVVKQLSAADDPLIAIPINSLLPHQLAQLCAVANARLIHMSTDCVFSGKTGMYTEEEAPDATDLYGQTKLLGEVKYPHTITIRTSIIGHELSGARSLINWFLAQEGQTQGFTKAVFSGLPTVEIAGLIRDHVVPNKALHGLYHVSADPINKFDLLTLVAETYGKKIEIQPNDSVVIDRSLNSDLFRTKTGYTPASWPELVRLMHRFG